MKLLRRVIYVLRHRQAEAELAEEMAFHEAMIRRDMEESGANETEATAGVWRAMGNRTLSREDARAVWIWPWLESIWQDLAYGARSLRRDAGFTLVAVLALAIAIGLNTSLFTVFNAVALRPWPVKDPGSVVKIYAIDKNPPKGFDAVNGFSPVEQRYFAEHSKTMAGLFLTRGEGGLHLDKAPKTRAEYVTGSYFSVLGVDMERGRGFLPEEDRPDSPSAVLVLSHSIWQNRYGGDPAIIGRRLKLDDIPFTVVGVTSDRFRGTSPEATDIWLPMASGILLHPNDPGLRDFLIKPHYCCLDMSGRIAPGFTREQARAELAVLHADFEGQQHQGDADGVLLAGTPILQQPGRKVRAVYAVFSLIFAGVMMVLLLACANVGNLLLARAAARRREIGVRLSLGAGRWRLVRQLLTESLALAGIAAALGLVLAYVLPAPLLQRVAGEVSFYLRPDGTVLAYSLGLAVFACLAFGLAPALHATRGSFSDALRKRHSGAGRLRSLLLTVQVTLSVVLLVGAGLLMRGIQRVQSQDPGFAIHGVAAVAFDFPTSAYGSARMNAFFTGMEQGLRELPGAPPPAWTRIEPLGSQRAMSGVSLPGEEGREQWPILADSASAAYFDVLRIPILAGRNFEAADAARKVVLVNKAFAERYFPGQSAVGRRIVLIRTPYEIVGVVGNASVWGLNQVEPCLFTPVSFGEGPRLLTAQTPANLAAIAALAKNLDTRVRLRVTPLRDNYDRWLDASRMGARIAGLLGVFALVLASIGIAGVFAYAVQQRTQEIGIRIALGARPANVVAVVLASGARSLLAGLVLGLAGALAGSKLLQGYLYGLNRLDPITYTAVLLMLGVAGLAATYLPARRAVKLDPTRALHYE